MTEDIIMSDDDDDISSYHLPDITHKYMRRVLKIHDVERPPDLSEEVTLPEKIWVLSSLDLTKRKWQAPSSDNRIMMRQEYIDLLNGILESLARQREAPSMNPNDVGRLFPAPRETEDPG
jgi:hypothetical protein